MATVSEALASAMREHQAGRIAAAEAVYRQILDADPKHSDAMRLLGLVAHQRRQHQLAIDLISRAIALRATPLHYQNLGMAYCGLGRLDDAAACYRQALAIDPRLIDAHIGLGNLHSVRGELTAAADCYRHILSFAPNHGLALNNLGNVLGQLGKEAAALECYRAAVAAQPDFALGHHSLSGALQERGDFAAAIRHCRRAVELDPNYAEAHNSLGFLLAQGGQIISAMQCYQRALALKPDFAKAHNNLGVAYFNEGQAVAARACYERALAADPDYAPAHLNRGLVDLLLGDFVNGWRDYEWRWKINGVPAPRAGLDRPFWRGEPLDSRRILLSGEQGLGDALQFVRYAPMVAARGGRVLLQVKPALRRLLATVPAVDSVSTIDEPLPPFDVHCPLLSLPLAFGTELATVPAAVPYVFADPAAAAAWRDRLGAAAVRVGLVWAGSTGHNRDARRSLDLAALAPLAAVPGISFVSLQKGPPASQAAHPPAGMQLLDAASELDDLADTAAAIAAMDLVITVDTAAAHLAGALGKPVWILLAYAPDFRWLLGREDSPWYPTARLFRQASADAWGPVVARLAGELGRLAAGDKSVLMPAGIPVERDQGVQAILVKSPDCASS